MLTPEKLSSYEFNKVTKLYNQLNIDISSDIIRRIEKMGDITESSKYQIKKLIQLDGKEIFNKALLETAKLDNATISSLKELYEDMAYEDMQGYKELYNYRDVPFKLKPSQYQILNAGVNTTKKELKNFTNSIAFSSKELYINAVDKAYNKVVTGAFDYNTAIKQAYKEVAEQGITLKDKAGRNVNLDVAVRRNVLNGIKTTANEMNRDIEKQLGCDGYEVTSHIGARPTHAEAQGKQYALNEKDARKYKLGLWEKVKDLWEEYNCRHTYFGIILGVSEPQYEKSELKELKEATVTLNGKKVPYYEATERQRAIERDIRETKRTIDTLYKADKQYKEYNDKLKQLYIEYNKFTNETGLIKQSERLKV
jgi:hypothetical protein